MPRLYYTAIYSVALLASLTLLSFYFYQHPGQVEERIRQSLDRVLDPRVGVTIENCRQDSDGELTISRLSLSTPPTPVAREVLELQGLRVVRAGRLWYDLAREIAPAAPNRPSPGSPGKSRLLADRLRLWLEHGPDGIPSLRSLLAPENTRESTTGAGSTGEPVSLRVESFGASVQAQGGAAESPAEALEFAGTDLTVIGSMDDDLVLSGLFQVLDRGTHFDPSFAERFELRIDSRGRIQHAVARLRLSDLRALKSILPGGLARFDSDFSPTGPLRLELGHFEQGTGEQPDRLAAVLQLADVRLDLGAIGSRVSHVSGLVRISNDTVSVDESSPLHGRLRSHPVEVWGQAGTHTSDWTLRLSTVDAQQLESLRLNGLAGELFGHLGLRGACRLTLKLGNAEKSGARLEGRELVVTAGVALPRIRVAALALEWDLLGAEEESGLLSGSTAEVTFRASDLPLDVSFSFEEDLRFEPGRLEGRFSSEGLQFYLEARAPGRAVCRINGSVDRHGALRGNGILALAAGRPGRLLKSDQVPLPYLWGKQHLVQGPALDLRLSGHVEDPQMEITEWRKISEPESRFNATPASSREF